MTALPCTNDFSLTVMKSGKAARVSGLIRGCVLGFDLAANPSPAAGRIQLYQKRATKGK